MLRRVLMLVLTVSAYVGISSSASIAATGRTLYQPVEKAVEASVTNAKPPAAYSPSLAEFVPNNQLAGESTVNNCDAYGKTSQLRTPIPCVEGDVSSPRIIVLVGDSNVGNWAPGLSSGLAKSHYKLDVFSFAGCPTSDINYVAADYIGTTPASCNEWHQNVVRAISALSPVAIVTASSGIGSQYNQKAWDKGYETLFAKASGGRSSVHRIVIGTSPYFATPPPTCLARNPTAPLRCLMSTKTTTMVGAYSSYASRDAAVAKASDATLISTSSLFCFKKECAAEVAGTVTMVDSDHVTTAYSEELSAPLTNALLAALKS